MAFLGTRLESVYSIYSLLSILNVLADVWLECKPRSAKAFPAMSVMGAVTRRLASKQPWPLGGVAPTPTAPVVTVAAALVKRRLKNKQVPPPAYAILSPGEQAIAAEAWAEMTALDPDARRKHIHWVQPHTDDPNDLQPETFTRQSFFQHLCKCYKEAYPESANRHGSILLFGGGWQKRPTRMQLMMASGWSITMSLPTTFRCPPVPPDSNVALLNVTSDVSFPPRPPKLQCCLEPTFQSQLP